MKAIGRQLVNGAAALVIVTLPALILFVVWQSTLDLVKPAQASSNAPVETPNPSGTVAIPPTSTPPPGCGLHWRAIYANTPWRETIFSGVAAISPTDVWAVGHYQSAGSYRTLTLHWDGTQWTHVPSPNPGNAGILYGVSAISPTDVWAVGNSYPGGGLIMHWDGTQWTHVPGPNPGSILYGVAAISPTDVWAVGSGGGTGTLTMHWDGTQWTRVPSPNPSMITHLSGVTAVSPTDVWAVGHYYGGGQYRTLTLHWDGTQWTHVPSPNPGTSDVLNGVTAVSPTDVWAVGHYYGGGQYRTLTLHWDGTQWSVVVSPNPTVNHISAQLLAVDSISTGAVWAVGHYAYYYDPNYPDMATFIIEWNGTQWQILPSSNPGSANELHSVSALSATDVWAVGRYERTYAYTYVLPLAIRYDNPPCGSPTATRTSTATGTATSTSTLAISTSTLATSTPISTSTYTPTAISTSTSIPSSTGQVPCTLSFSDVPEGSTFYPFVRCLACRGIISGYSDGTFRPGNDVTRGQLAKIVANAADINEPISGQRFSDVPPSHTFYEFIERMAGREIISGYADGTFRPGNPATRGQISKIVANAANMNEPVNGQRFTDVPPTHTFYEFIERMAAREIISGYADGTFRPGNNATRGQVSKIVSNAFFPNCNPAIRR